MSTGALGQGVLVFLLHFCTFRIMICLHSSLSSQQFFSENQLTATEITFVLLHATFALPSFLYLSIKICTVDCSSKIGARNDRMAVHVSLLKPQNLCILLTIDHK